MGRKYNIEDYVGKTYAHLTILGYDHTEEKYNRDGHRYKRIYVKCKCDCGNECVVQLHRILSGNTKSCGHLKKESYKYSLKTNTTHGMSNTHLFKIWQGMRYRCNTPTSPDYDNYGGRGIKVYKPWDESFMEFYNWAISVGYYEQPKGTPYGDMLSIERIDPNGDYCPENCKFIPFRDQLKNKRSSLFVIDYDGERLTLTDIARKYGVNPKTVYNYRHNKNWKWSIDKIVFYLHNQHLNIEVDSKTKEHYLVDENGFKVLIPTIEFMLRKNGIEKRGE